VVKTQPGQRSSCSILASAFGFVSNEFGAELSVASTH
jgi:hypothetical protein